MPNPDLQSYIASRYLSGPKADAILARSGGDGKPKRKKKRPAPEAASNGLVFKDDSDAWPNAATTSDGEDEAQVVADSASGSSGFKKVGTASTPTTLTSEVAPPTDTGAGGEVEFKAGLRTKEEMRAARLAREERRRTAPSPPPAPASVEEGGEEEETVYRDSSGRRIDIHAAEREAALHEAEQRRKAAERKTWSQGLAQQKAAKDAASQLASVRDQTVARRVTDAEYNRHFKDQLHADDPALAFLTKKRTQGPAKPAYKGPWPPNRFNIPPGYRWDGVDRSNGFEKLLVERKHALAAQEQQARAWGQSDM
ncbi:bud site selection-related protein [Moesziomyces antarcticus]|uniref:Related to BUD13 - subunit of the RES complex, required for pre-mRNA retention and splicing n=1 Tax=Pseudozyma antarctica TaxID=84753 RepID=A0A5C3FFV3_PSEA2|nr:bud site selection-related protein [Moesziomyces antarcticus]GAK62483.1 bud site selection-related protein [Moesziomyces antarcticus]SPO43036.1 related to BUD13 - subunit of the RES complex, required for pre-mRNA retention and splicing [Moesziomyces antarcticus]